MLATVALALLGFSAAYCDTTELLMTKNLRDNHDVHTLCRVSKLQKLYEIEYDQTLNDLEYDLTPIRKLQSENLKFKVDLCCNKYSIFHKKQCLINIREQLLDIHCKTGLTHICCLTPVPQRHVCFAKNPLSSLRHTGLNTLKNLDYTLNRLENFEIDNKYTQWKDVEDVLDDQRTDKIQYQKEKINCPWLKTQEVYGESVLDLENELDTIVPYPFVSRKCDSNHCRRQLIEKATRVAAKQTCLKNTLKAGQELIKTCCQAGALVGTIVDKHHKNVCLPAVYKFQSKTQGCGVNHIRDCKVAFVACCKQTRVNSEASVSKYGLENELTTDSYENIVDELTTPFKTLF